MRPSNAPKLKLGDTLDGIVVKATGGRRFLLKCKAAPHGWKVELHSRSPEGIEPGSNVHVWVGKINPLKTSLLTYDGDYGRLPISNAMGVRYRKALLALNSDGEISGDELADLRSMLTRISDQNQADWLTVWKTLDEPSSGDTKEFAAALINLRDLRKTDQEEAANLRQNIRVKYTAMIEVAIRRLEDFSE